MKLIVYTAALALSISGVALSSGASAQPMPDNGRPTMHDDRAPQPDHARDQGRPQDDHRQMGDMQRGDDMRRGDDTRRSDWHDRRDMRRDWHRGQRHCVTRWWHHRRIRRCW